MRLKIGPSSSLISRTKTTSDAKATTPTSTGPVSGVPVKADLSLSFGQIDPGADPLTVQVIIPPYDLSVVNSLVSLTAIAIPFGAGKPSDANGYMTSSYPKATVEPSPAAKTELLLTAPVQNPVGASTPAPLQAQATATTATPAQEHLPGPSGGPVTLAIHDVPDGKYEIQLIEGYDV